MTQVNSEPTLSVIVPAYNVGKYISDTLDSLAQQTENPDEIIVIDDGSTDDTAEIIKNHDLSKLVTFIQTENRGQGSARNTGINRAKSEYLYFFDADDLLVPHFIAEIKHNLRQDKNPDLVFFSGEAFIDKRLDTTSFVPPKYIRDFELKAVDQQTFLKRLLTVHKLSCSPCLYVSRRSLWSDHNLSFNRYFHEDEEILYPLVFSAKKISITRDVYFLRRVRSDSTMTGRITQRHADGQAALLASLITLIQIYRNDNLKLRLLRRRLSHFILSYIHASRASKTVLNKKLLFLSLIKSRSIKITIKAVIFLLIK